MNWDALGAAAEIVGALGVLASLIYLAIQIRQNTTWLRQQAFQLSTNEVRQWAMQFSSSADSAEIFLRGQRDQGSLDQTERFRFTMMIFEICSVWATYQEHSDEDLLGLQDSAEKTVSLWIEQGWFRGWWGNNEFMFSVAFKRFVNGLLERKAADA